MTTAASALSVNLYRMLVERGQSFDARRRVVGLVEDNPEAAQVTHAVPLVENECADEPLQNGTLKPRQME